LDFWIGEILGESPVGTLEPGIVIVLLVPFSAITPDPEDQVLKEFSDLVRLPFLAFKIIEWVDLASLVSLPVQSFGLFA
jgi:hypothetical protein